VRDRIDDEVPELDPGGVPADTPPQQRPRKALADLLWRPE
jgi:hypothetical protein